MNKGYLAYLKLSFIALNLLLLVACASKGPRAVFHVVDMENRGEEIYQFHIEYGDISMPFQSGPDPEFARKSSSTFLNEMVVPVSAKVFWKTKDGMYYCPNVEIRRYVTDPNNFDGNVEFNIENDRLEVYVFPDVKMKKLREKFIPIFSGIEKCVR